MLRKIAITGVLLAGVLTASTAAAADNRFSILYHEPVRELQFDTQPGVAFLAAEPTSRPQVATASFSAFGRVFDLELQSNSRLIVNLLKTSLKDTLTRYTLYRGKITGNDQSWVRLTLVDGQLVGMIWDGAELYSIEPGAMIRLFAVQPITTADNDLVIYRWSDTIADLGWGTDIVRPVPGSNKGSVQFDRLVNELSGAAQTLVTEAAQIDIGIVGDFEFVQSHSSDPVGDMIIRMNSVEGIYGDQLGIDINVTEITTFPSNIDPFTTSDSVLLLDEMASFKFNDLNYRPLGLAHLFTGRDLDDDIIGIAFSDALCDDTFGVGVSQTVFNATMDSLIIAHEMGHNFGAPHDGEAGSACASSPEQLMGPFIGNSSTFSTCSMSQMVPPIRSAVCITNLGAPNVFPIFSDDPQIVLLGKGFDHRVRLNNAGPGNSYQSSLEILYDPNLVIIGLLESGNVTCSNSSTMVNCDVYVLEPVGPTQQAPVLQSQFTATSVGTFPVTATLSDPDDPDNSDDTVNGTIIVNPAVNLVVTSPQETINEPIYVRPNDMLSVSYQVENRATIDSPDTEVVIDVPIEYSVVTVTPEVGNCTVSATQVTCPFGTLPPGAMRTVDLDLEAVSLGVAVIIGDAFSSLPEISNNNHSRVSTFISDRLVDFSFSIGPTPPTIIKDQPFTVSFYVDNLSPADAAPFTFLAGVRNTAVVDLSIDSGTCQVAGAGTLCTMPGLAAGGRVQLDLTITPSFVSQTAFEVFLGSASTNIDIDSSNDSASRPVSIVAGGTQGSSGGGGAALWLIPFLLLTRRCAAKLPVS